LIRDNQPAAYSYCGGYPSSHTHFVVFEWVEYMVQQGQPVIDLTVATETRNEDTLLSWQPTGEREG
jgi:hypothetical protein